MPFGFANVSSVLQI